MEIFVTKIEVAVALKGEGTLLSPFALFSGNSREVNMTKRMNGFCKEFKSYPVVRSCVESGQASDQFVVAVVQTLRRIFRESQKVLPFEVRRTLKRIAAEGWGNNRSENLVLCETLSQLIFERLPKQYQSFANSSHGCPVNFFGLKIGSSRSKTMTVWFGGLKSRRCGASTVLLPQGPCQTITWKDRVYQVAFTKHAIDRIFERFVSHDRLSYESAFRTFRAINGINPFDVWVDASDSLMPSGISFWEDPTQPGSACERSNMLMHICSLIVDRELEDGEHYRLGYGTGFVDDDLICITTALRPGYRGTPEEKAMTRLGFPHDDSDGKANNLSELTRNPNCWWLTQYHKYGVPQIDLPTITVG